MHSHVLILVLIVTGVASAAPPCGRSALHIYRSEADFGGFGATNARWDAAAGGLRIDKAGAATLASGEVPVPGLFDQLVISWNTRTPPGSRVVVYARVRVGETWSRRFTVGIWHRDSRAPERTSVPDQADDLARMDTDTLVARRPANAYRIDVELRPGDGGRSPLLSLLAAQTLNSKAALAPPTPHARTATEDLPVPELSQLSVPHGNVWCSPTSVAMVLRYWSRVLGRPELKVGIKQAAAGIHDKAYAGTGNWPFNTAYASEFGGLTAYVARFESVAELERWIAARVPVIVSVDRNTLTRSEGGAMGHLVVVRGFTADGQVILNDPYDPRSEGKGVHVTYPRVDFERAWLGAKGSYGTVYLIYPRGWETPQPE